MSESDKERLNEIFYRVSVCRSFRMGGLESILTRFPLTGEMSAGPDLISIIGELSAEGYISNSWHSVADYIVNTEQVKESVLESKQASTFCKLHDAWRDHYQDRYDKRYKYHELAALLYHETAYEEYCRKTQGSLLNFLIENTKRRFWQYYQFLAQQFPGLESLPTDLKKARQVLLTHLEQSGHDDLKQEFQEYIFHLITRIQDLQKFEGLLSESELQKFFDFLKSLDLRRERHA